jgi:hypothetical protein
MNTNNVQGLQWDKEAQNPQKGPEQPPVDCFSPL